MRKRLKLASAALLAIAAGGIASASVKGMSGAAAAEPHLVPLEMLEVPIVDSGHVEGTLRVRFTLNAASGSAADALTDRLPEVRATALDASSEFARIYASGLTPVNAEMLKSRAKAALQKAHPEVADLLVVQVSAEPA